MELMSQAIIEVVERLPTNPIITIMVKPIINHKIERTNTILIIVVTGKLQRLPIRQEVKLMFLDTIIHTVNG